LEGRLNKWYLWHFHNIKRWIIYDIVSFLITLDIGPNIRVYSRMSLCNVREHSTIIVIVHEALLLTLGRSAKVIFSWFISNLFFSAAIDINHITSISKPYRFLLLDKATIKSTSWNYLKGTVRNCLITHYFEFS
jgi:hypothetical protein